LLCELCLNRKVSRDQIDLIQLCIVAVAVVSIYMDQFEQLRHVNTPMIVL